MYLHTPKEVLDDAFLLDATLRRERERSSLPRVTKQLGPIWTPVPWEAVTIDDPFWTPHLRVNREHTLPQIYRICQETGRIDAFRLNWKPGMESVPHIFDQSLFDAVKESASIQPCNDYLSPRQGSACLRFASAGLKGER